MQRGLPIQLLLKYFKKSGDQWQVNPEIKGMVKYRKLNLLDSFAMLGVFDIVFCRNVLIYFDVPTKENILAASPSASPAMAICCSRRGDGDGHLRCLHSR